jgi:hypothetical protein
MFVLSLNACATETEKQWYKPGANYTMAEFHRDEAACTKNKVLDEECMKERGWVALSADKDTIAPMQGGLQSPKPGRYAPGSQPK